MSIPLSGKHGLNPALTFCPVCGHEAEELLLLGSSTIWQCASCKTKELAYAGRGPKTCQKCGSTNLSAVERQVDGSTRRFPATQPCKKCSDILEKSNLLICPDCRQMFEVNLTRVLSEIDLREITGEQAIEKGLAERITGKVIRKNCGCLPKEEKG
jgi:transcription elongation factor Elf1